MFFPLDLHDSSVSNSRFLCLFLFLEAVAEIENKIKQLKLANQKLARNSRAGTIYETIKEESTKTLSGSDMAKVEETVLFAREIVENSATRIPGLGFCVSLLIVVMSRIAFY